MSYHSDKCTPEELSLFKKEVISWLRDYGIVTDNLNIRAYNCYGGDVRIYTGDTMEFTNKKSSFRRIKADTVTEGSKTTYYDTRGHHTTRLICPLVINRLEWNYFKKEMTGENKGCFDDYHKLEKLKKRG